MVFDPTTQFSVFYSYSVNQGAANTPPPQTATLIIEQGSHVQHLDQRWWQQIWNAAITGSLGTLLENTNIIEYLTKLIIRPITETTSITEIQLRKPIP